MMLADNEEATMENERTCADCGDPLEPDEARHGTRCWPCLDAFAFAVNAGWVDVSDS